MTEAPGAVVVNYNAGSHLVACIRSLRAEGVERIVVADNASTDGSLEAAVASDPDIEVVHTGSNLGFGSAANRGAARLDGDVLIMNPDAVVEPGAVKALAAVLEHDPVVGIVGPRIENPDGSLYPSPRTFPALGDAVGHAFVGLVAPRNRYTRRYRMLDWDHANAARAEWVSGSCMLVRHACFDAIGGFDERYFMYLEDVDLCWRAHRAGWAVAYEPAARVVHVQGVSTDLNPYRMIAAHHRSLFQFWWGTTAPPRRTLLAPLVAAGLAVRTGLAALQRLLDGVRRR
ncbi:MAG: N-acetylglucosaminyl-diphospho-decaprenol L-rhamnosyltransferase [Actinomycetota bacterium]|jgi:N-acetylglucosaminyl-diphospho-decaprenol L-rhamnosyltransferase